MSIASVALIAIGLISLENICSNTCAPAPDAINRNSATAYQPTAVRYLSINAPLVLTSLTLRDSCRSTFGLSTISKITISKNQFCFPICLVDSTSSKFAYSNIVYTTTKEIVFRKSANKNWLKCNHFVLAYSLSADNPTVSNRLKWSFCLKTYKNKRMLSYHRRKSGCGNFAADPSDVNQPMQPIYRCTKCSYKSYYSGYLDRHIRYSHLKDS